MALARLSGSMHNVCTAFMGVLRLNNCWTSATLQQLCCLLGLLQEWVHYTAYQRNDGKLHFQCRSSLQVLGCLISAAFSRLVAN